MGQVLAAPVSFETKRATTSSRLPFILFILLTATLFLRPAEIIERLEGLPIYQGLIVACMALSFPQIIQQFRTQSLMFRPVTLCVVGLLFAVIASQLSHLELHKTADSAIEFSKILVYYLLMVALINSTQRLRLFMYWVLFFTFGLTVLAFLHYQPFCESVGIETWHMPAFVTDVERQDGQFDANGAPVDLQRMAAAGIFGNSNDFSRLMVLAIVLALYCATDRKSPIPRGVWVAMAIVFLYALKCTYSRGGLTALLASLAVLAFCKLTFRQFVMAAILFSPLLLIAFGGRQLDMDATQGTGHTRILLWRDGFSYMKEAPIFGIGMNEYADRAGLVAHNSYVHGFTELGLFGGTLFVGAFFIAAWGTYESSKAPRFRELGDLKGLRPFVLALLGGTIMGMFTSARCYTVPTYLILALATAYLAVVENGTGWRGMRLNALMVKRTLIVSMGTLVLLYMYVRLATAGQ